MCRGCSDFSFIIGAGCTPLEVCITFIHHLLVRVVNPPV
jgi:hypothetical protein